MKLIDVIYESVVDMYEIAKSSKEEFIKKAQEKHKNEDGSPRYLYDKVDYVNSRIPVTITCPTHGDFIRQPKEHINNNSGCDKCGRLRKSKNLTITSNEFIKKSQQLHQDSDGNPLYNYDKVNFINNKTPVTITCPKHGDFIQLPYIHKKGHGCSKCVESKGEIGATQFFKENNISHISQKKFDGCFNMENSRKICYKLPFDFYIPESKIVIEIDGNHHFFPLNGSESFRKRISNDELKNKFAKSSTEISKLIRIYYTGKNITEVISELNRLLNDESPDKIVLSKNYPKAGWNK